MTRVSLHSTLKKLLNLLNFNRFFHYSLKFAIVVSGLWLSQNVLAAAHIEVVALFESKAMLLIDDERTLLKVGETTANGVKLISADAKSAVIEQDGERRRYLLGSTVRSSGNSQNSTNTDTQIIRVYRGIDNFFKTVGSINGYPINFLVDTGASVIAINSSDAKRLGINYRLDGKQTKITTASGVEDAFGVNLDRVSIAGVTIHNVRGVVLEGTLPATPLLGMSYLSRFDIKNDGQVMTLIRKF